MYGYLRTLLQAGVTPGQADENSGTVTLTLAAGHLTFDNRDRPPPCTATYRRDGRRFILSWDRGTSDCTGDGQFSWSADPAGLHLTDFQPSDGVGEIVDRVVWTGRVWQRGT